jgi:two-component system cell cycle response regulator CpdR
MPRSGAGALATAARFGHRKRRGGRASGAAGSGAFMVRILLAEDDSSMRTYLGRALERAGYEVVAVDRGTAALPLIAAESFDLLLTDIVMPEMDGIELAQKAAVVAPAMRVMFITGFAAVALKAGKAAPSAKVLSKPFHLRDLVAEVDRLFQSEDRHGRL